MTTLYFDLPDVFLGNAQPDANVRYVFICPQAWKMRRENIESFRFWNAPIPVHSPPTLRLSAPPSFIAPFSTPDFISLSSDSSLSDRNAKGFKILANDKRKSGPVTDYGSSTVQWMRHRRGNRTKIEQERPSPSYIIDVCPTSISVPCCITKFS